MKEEKHSFRFEATFPLRVTGWTGRGEDISRAIATGSYTLADALGVDIPTDKEYPSKGVIDNLSKIRGGGLRWRLLRLLWPDAAASINASLSEILARRDQWRKSELVRRLELLRETLQDWEK